MARPNILWICTDSQRWDTLGCYGNALVRTPHVDGLAGRGVLFEQVYCQNPLCTPSRGSFLTGRYPSTMGLRQNGQDIRASEVPITRLLAEAGYHCGLVGKLHLSACDHRIQRFGKSEWWKHDSALFFQGTERRIDDGYAEVHWDHAPSGTNPASAYTKWLRDKGVTVRTPPRDDCRWVHHGMPVEHHQTTWCAEQSISFIQGHAGRPYPWLLSVNIFDPHFTIDPPEAFLRRYLERLDDIPLPLWQEGELEGKPPHHRHYIEKSKMGRNAMGERDHRICRAGYWAMVDLIDVQVGRILEALEKSGQAANTLVVFTSDHGEMLGDHGIYVKGPFMYDGAVRVPLIISLPGVVGAGHRVSGLHELIDLPGTLLDAAGVARHGGMQGRSFWPQLTGGSGQTAAREDVYCEYSNSNPDGQYATMARTAEHKIVVWHGQPLGELYDLQADPAEHRNCWDDPAYAAGKSVMLKRVCDRMAFTADPMPPRIGIY